MNRRLFWRLNFSLLALSLILFSGLHHLSSRITLGMTEVSADNQTRIRELALEIEGALLQGDEARVLQVQQRIRREYGVWSGVRLADHRLLADQPIPEVLRPRLGFQRQVNWPVHPFMQHLLIGEPFTRSGGSFILQLPRSMYPQGNTALVHSLLTIILPSLIMTLFCWLAYRYLMQPLEAMNKGALRLADGDLSARVLPDIRRRRADELTRVAISFDRMADQVEQLVSSQRQLLGDLSHELRTPLTRLALALEISETEPKRIGELQPRLKRELAQMHQLVEDALTLAWLEGEPEIETGDAFNLTTLLDLICEDAGFEFPGRQIRRDYPAQLPLRQSSQMALAQTLENALRNALKYSPEDEPVRVSCCSREGEYRVTISDRGPGVPEAYLEKIFDPFFRTDKARSREVGGFGLGLALCKRQVRLLGGEIRAELNTAGGLDIVLTLPAGA
ncbi:ATP-binding protein [Neptuniibacter halophilus]|uniref:ATP-binding protein n=1 Tax=Neptuniibacter halophilus TaxID=651666 RepID=UPI0025727739|nr:ATP-binding protein [Neptuniibacter halophilus]